MASLWDDAKDALADWENAQELRRRKETGRAVGAVNVALSKLFGGAEAIFCENGALVNQRDVFALVGFSGPCLVKKCPKGHTIRVAALTVTGDTTVEEVRARVARLLSEGETCDICQADVRPSADIKRVIDNLTAALGTSPENLDWQVRIAIDGLGRVVRQMEGK